ncbi:MAG: P-II family nitrogen regulator [Nitrospiraceae bacterium]|nr:P-II family nitrogen regulator [Nitrospiraceae bacterium]
MKKIEAYIKSHKLSEVTMALQHVEGLRGMSVLFARGFGHRDAAEKHPKLDDLMDFSEHAKIEIFCNDDLVEELVDVIGKNAVTGLRGDGKIYVMDVIGAVKIGKGRIE